MAFDLHILETLLYQEEGPALDFKEEQYKLSNADIGEKAELLKDILTFANSWRLTTAYILAGVREVKAGRSELIGVKYHLDDANLHQFVNSKTQKPIGFSYLPIRAEGVEIGVIEIPIQERPIYLKARFGQLRENDVWIRDSSSSRIATSDEVAKMGADQVLSGTPPLASEWTDDRIILSLEKSIDTIAGLKNAGVHAPDFKEWHRATLGMIKSAFGDRSIHYWEFRDIVDDLHPMRLYGFFGWKIITGSWKGVLVEKLDDVAELLASFVNEIKQYGNAADTD